MILIVNYFACNLAWRIPSSELEGMSSGTVTRLYFNSSFLFKALTTASNVGNLDLPSPLIRYVKRFPAKAFFDSLIHQTSSLVAESRTGIPGCFMFFCSSAGVDRSCLRLAKG